MKQNKWIIEYAILEPHGTWWTYEMEVEIDDGYAPNPLHFADMCDYEPEEPITGIFFLGIMEDESNYDEEE